MKKTISLLLALCCLFAVLTGCGGSKKTMEPRAFVDDVLANANFTDSLSQLDDAVIPQYYGVDSADYKSALVYCGTAATAEQIVCFEAVDAAAAHILRDHPLVEADRGVEVVDAAVHRLGKPTLPELFCHNKLLNRKQAAIPRPHQSADADSFPRPGEAFKVPPCRKPSPRRGKVA